MRFWFQGLKFRTFLSGLSHRPGHRLCMRNLRLCFLALLIGSLFSACQKVVVIVEKIPSKTPLGSSIFLAGNINYWDPGDPNFRLQPMKDSTWQIVLPVGWGSLEYKFTRGDWTTVEEDQCGGYLLNRVTNYGSQDTIRVQISSWEDLGAENCNRVTFLVSPPPYTKADDSIYIAGNFNNWQAADKDFQLKRRKDNRYEITIPKTVNNLEYKFTKGDWSAEELDEYGNNIENRTFNFGENDTVKIGIAHWKDYEASAKELITIRVRVPANTPKQDTLYLAGSFNGWKAKDKDYQLKRLATGMYQFQLKRNQKGPLEFKFTRGKWTAVECDKQGRGINNRVIRVGFRDTVQLSVQKWLDFK